MSRTVGSAVLVSRRVAEVRPSVCRHNEGKRRLRRQMLSTEQRSVPEADLLMMQVRVPGLVCSSIYLYSQR